MLLRRTAAIIGEDAESCVLCDNETSLMVALGLPTRSIVARALECYPNAETLIANPAHANAFAAILEGWEFHPTRVHVLDRPRPPAPRVQECRWLRKAEILGVENGPELVRDNLLVASRRSRIAAAFVGQQPVSFCFASSHTESFWNVSVETLEPYRRKGFGTACVRWMAERRLARRMRPVWGAAESNTASLAMAASLGFAPVDLIAVFRRPRYT